MTVDVEGGAEEDVRFRIPPWVPRDAEWRYRLGQILRVLLTGQADYTKAFARLPKPSSSSRYVAYRSSWLRRCYGLFNGREAFGPAWLPISTWFGSLLSRLLEWPGFSRGNGEVSLADAFTVESLHKSFWKGRRCSKGVMQGHPACRFCQSVFRRRSANVKFLGRISQDASWRRSDSASKARYADR